MSELKSISKFMFYENFFLAIEKLPEEKRAKACYEFCKYGITGELPKDENIAMFCIGVSASVQKYQGRGGFREGSGRKSKESKESKESYDTNINRNINLNLNRNINLNLNNKLKDKTENPSYNQNENQIENKFDEFWKLYTPVKASDGRFVAKGSKQKCFEKYKKLINEGVEHGKIINGLERYLAYCRINGHCSCGAEVFINQRRFENDYSDSECVSSSKKDNGRRPVSISKIAFELERESKIDEKDSIPF